MLLFHSNDYIQKIDRVIEEKNASIKFNIESHDEFKKDILEKIKPENEQILLWDEKRQKLINQMVKRRYENYCMLKERYIITKWRAHNDRYQKGSRAL